MTEHIPRWQAKTDMFSRSSTIILVFHKQCFIDATSLLLLSFSCSSQQCWRYWPQHQVTYIHTLHTPHWPTIKHNNSHFLWFCQTANKLWLWFRVTARYCDQHCWSYWLSKVLALNLSRPSGRLLLCAGLNGSSGTCWLRVRSGGWALMQWALLSVWVILLLPHGCEFGWTFLLVPAHPGSPRQRAVKQLCMCKLEFKNHYKGFLEYITL